MVSRAGVEVDLILQELTEWKGTAGPSGGPVRGGLPAWLVLPAPASGMRGHLDGSPSCHEISLTASTSLKMAAQAGRAGRETGPRASPSVGAVLVCWGCPRKVLQDRGLEKQKCLSSRFQKL